MLKLFLLEDSERHWIAAESAEEAEKLACAEHYVEIDDTVITEVPMDERLVVYFYEDEPSRGSVPADIFMDEEGGRYCAATVAEWLALAKSGDMICTTAW